MELVALEMKLRGSYIARQLPLPEVAFVGAEIPLSELEEEIYNSCCNLWEKFRSSFDKAKKLLKMSSESSHIMWNQFWATHQRVFKWLCTSFKIDSTVELTRDALKRGECVIIGLQHTGAAKKKAEEHSYPGLSDLLKVFVESYFPNPDRGGWLPGVGKSKRKLLNHPEESKKKKPRKDKDDDDDPPSDADEEEVRRLKKELLEAIDEIGELPSDNMSTLIEKLEETEEVKVADLTGRCAYAGGDTSRSIIAKQQEFTNGQKNVAIISGRSGLQLHDIRTHPDQLPRQRLHITLELGWTAGGLLHQFGLSNRTNQVSAPRYVIMQSAVPAELRFDYAVAKKMEELGALTRGDHHTADVTSLSQFNVGSIHGREALMDTIEYASSHETILPEGKCFVSLYFKTKKIFF